MNYAEPIASWHFDVWDIDGESQVTWAVVEAHTGVTLASGLTDSDLALAILEAYDAVGLVCPLVPDADAARLAGSAVLGDHPTNGEEL